MKKEDNSDAGDQGESADNVDRQQLIFSSIEDVENRNIEVAESLASIHDAVISAELSNVELCSGYKVNAESEPPQVLSSNGENVGSAEAGSAIDVGAESAFVQDESGQIYSVSLPRNLPSGTFVVENNQAYIRSENGEYMTLVFDVVPPESFMATESESQHTLSLLGEGDHVAADNGEIDIEAAKHLMGEMEIKSVAEPAGRSGFAVSSALVDHALQRTGAEGEDASPLSTDAEAVAAMGEEVVEEAQSDDVECDPVDDPSQLHVCPRCKAFFSTSRYLKDHMRRACVRNQGPKHFHCEFCPNAYKMRHQLQRHMMQHTGERPWKCHTCGKSFLSKSHLKRHDVIHKQPDEGIYQCQFCEKKFAWVASLEQHLKFHTGEKRFKCGICGRLFLHLGSLRSHMTNRHTVNGKFACVVCKETFDEATELILHMKSHNEQESVKCERCYAFFTSLNDLETHMCTNFGGKPLICIVCMIEFPDTITYCGHGCMAASAARKCGCCQKVLKSIWHLREHLITHTGEKPFQCVHCGKKFRRKRELDIHLTRHSSERPFKCPQCDGLFTSDNYMKQHMRKYHREKKFSCDVCKHTFMHKCALVNHMAYHSKTGNTKFGKKYHRNEDLLVPELVAQRLELEARGEKSRDLGMPKVSKKQKKEIISKLSERAPKDDFQMPKIKVEVEDAAAIVHNNPMVLLEDISTLGLPSTLKILPSSAVSHFQSSGKVKGKFNLRSAKSKTAPSSASSRQGKDSASSLNKATKSVVTQTLGVKLDPEKISVGQNVAQAVHELDQSRGDRVAADVDHNQASVARFAGINALQSASDAILVIDAVDEPCDVLEDMDATRVLITENDDHVNKMNAAVPLDVSSGFVESDEESDGEPIVKQVIEPRVCLRNAEQDPSNITTIYQTDMNGQLTVRCATCFRDFDNHGELLRHRKEAHDDGKPYQCDVCTRTFSVAANLSTHRNIHSIKRKFSCRHCGRSYKAAHGLREHLMAKHDENTEAFTDLELANFSEEGAVISDTQHVGALTEMTLTAQIGDKSDQGSYHVGLPTDDPGIVAADSSTSPSIVGFADEEQQKLLANIIFVNPDGSTSTGLSAGDLSKREDVSFLMNLSSLISQLGGVPGNQRIVIQQRENEPPSTD